MSNTKDKINKQSKKENGQDHQSVLEREQGHRIHHKRSFDRPSAPSEKRQAMDNSEFLKLMSEYEEFFGSSNKGETLDKSELFEVFMKPKGDKKK